MQNWYVGRVPAAWTPSTQGEESTHPRGESKSWRLMTTRTSAPAGTKVPGSTSILPSRSKWKLLGCTGYFKAYGVTGTWSGELRNLTTLRMATGVVGGASCTQRGDASCNGTCAGIVRGAALTTRLGETDRSRGGDAVARGGDSGARQLTGTTGAADTMGPCDHPCTEAGGIRAETGSRSLGATPG